MPGKIDSRDLKRFVDNLDRYQRLIDGRGARWITTEVSVKAKRVILDEARADTGGNYSLSGWRRPPRKPVKLRGGFEILSDHRSEFKPKPNGIWKVITEGRDSGISKRRATRGRVYGRTSGKGTWRRAWNIITPQVGRWTAQANSELVKNSWRMR